MNRSHNNLRAKGKISQAVITDEDDNTLCERTITESDWIFSLERWNGFLCCGLGRVSKNIKIWKENGESVCILEGHNNQVRCLIVWNDFLCSCSADMTIRLWNRDFNCVKIFSGHTQFVNCLKVWNSQL